MIATFYTISDFNNTIDREIGEGTEIQGVIKTTPWNILTPTFRVKTKVNGTFFPYNYVYLKDFGRYYFIENKEILANGLISVSCKVDVLKSYVQLIKDSSGFISRTVNYNKLVNNDYVTEETRNLETIEIPIAFGDGVNILLANKGGN